MISVALATYNSTKYIKQQLDSIRVQTMPIDEMIIVDDCSSDETVKFIQEYINQNKLKNWKVIVHKENRGYVETFKEAIKNTHGDIVFLCDHDDIWLENKVELINKEFEKNEKILALCTSFIQIDGDGNEMKINLKHNHSNNNLIRKKVKSHKMNKMSIYDVAIYNICQGCTMAISKDLKEIFISTNYEGLPHDWQLNLIAACLDELYYLDIPTIKYRVHNLNAIGLGHQSNLEKRKQIIFVNLKEKNTACEVVKKFRPNDIDCKQYFNNVKAIFEFRQKYISSKNILLCVKTIFKSFKFNKLYESIIMDMISMIKG